MQKHAWWVAWAAVLVLLIVMVAVAAVTVPRDAVLTHVSGVWMALAVDLSEGVFYRPLLSDEGYGGSRFMPLHFSLHAALIRLGLPVFRAGYVITFVCTLGLLAGVYHLMRGLGVGWKLRIPCTFLVLSTSAVQFAVLGIRGDLLPAALNIWGLALCVGPPGRAGGPRVGLASLFFVLAFMGKVTTVFGFLAAFLALCLAGQRKTAWRLAAWTFAGVLVALGVAHVASGGRALASMLACASGGMGVTHLLMAPVNALKAIAGWATRLLLMVALGGLLWVPRGAWKELPTLAFVTTAVVTLAIFASPGTEFNHYLDLSVVAVVFLTVQFARGRINAVFGACLAVLLAVLGCGVPLGAIDPARHSREQRVRESAVGEFAASEGPVLSEDTLLPVLAGRRPYLLDPFMFRVASLRRARLADDLLKKLAAGRFGVVILRCDPTTRSGRRFYERVHFGKGFVDTLLKHYTETGWHGSYVVYRPATPG